MGAYCAPNQYKQMNKGLRLTETADRKPRLTSLRRERLRRSAESGHNVSQEEMATELGISLSKYSQLENGSYNPGKVLAAKIGSVTGQTVGAVIDEYLERQGEREAACR